MKITQNTEINVHFNSLSNPTRMTYCATIQGKTIVLLDDDADMCDLLQIREVAGFDNITDWNNEVPDFETEMNDCNIEYLFLKYYTVKNSKLLYPFKDFDIPEIYYKLETLKK